MRILLLMAILSGLIAWALMSLDEAGAFGISEFHDYGWNTSGGK